MFIEIETKERGTTTVNTNNVEDIFNQGEQVFIEFSSGKEYELDTDKMSKADLMALLNGSA